jgi:uncharacterized membrane protein
MKMIPKLNKTFIVLALLVSLAYSIDIFTNTFEDVSSVCITTNKMMTNTSICDDFGCSNYTSNSICDYGCDSAYGRCRTIDAGYGGMVIAGFIFTIVVMLLLFQITRPKDEDEYDIPKVGFSMVFLIIGLIALGNLLLFIGSLGSNITSTFVLNASGVMLSMGDMIQLIVWAFAVMIVIVFIFRIFENRSRARNEQRRGE